MQKSEPNREPVLGIVLAAGKGTRMRSPLPKVLHEVHGKAMVEHVIDSLREGGVTDVVVVVGYRADLVRERLGDRVRYATQTEQLGTGHAVAAAKESLAERQGRVVVAYGDMPLLASDTVGKLLSSLDDPAVDCSLLTITLPNPPAAGRIVRGAGDRFQRIVEQQDCSPDQLAIREVNVGTYCFRAPSLLDALSKLRNDNNQGEYYLTDVPEIIARSGRGVVTVTADDIMETLGVNDREHLKVAEASREMTYAEGLYDLIDLVLEHGGSLDALLSIDQQRRPAGPEGPS